MVVVSLIVSIVAILMSAATALFTWQSAKAAERSAVEAGRSAKAAEDSAATAEASLEIQAAQDLRARRPKFSGKVERTNGQYWLHVTLESDERLEYVEPLAGATVQTLPGTTRHYQAESWQFGSIVRFYELVRS